MLISDPIGDMLARIKNAILAHHTTIILPHSKLKEAMLKKLLEHDYLAKLEVRPLTPQAEIEITLRYEDDICAISGLKLFSKPGRRFYQPAKKIPRALDGYGLTLVSTSKGILTGQEAKKLNVGGELLCQVW